MMSAITHQKGTRVKLSIQWDCLLTPDNGILILVASGKDSDLLYPMHLSSSSSS